jgi:hypothetical protein
MTPGPIEKGEAYLEEGRDRTFIVSLPELGNPNQECVG